MSFYMAAKLHREAAPYLRSQLRRGRLVLFTGAGFSNDVTDRDGRPLPTAGQLRRELWELCFPGEEPDGSTLADLFHHALARRPRAVERLLERRLRIDRRSLEPRHRLWFELPWRRIYTLNVDDLETAVVERFDLPRPLHITSALRARSRRKPAGLEVVHLNGHIDDGPRGITFSTIQYGERLARRCDDYAKLVLELRLNSFLFVGTQLGEAPLWQHIELLGGHASRRRPRSFLVTDRLDRARRSLLGDLGIEWIRMTSARFATEVLPRLA
jgi:hypothetical protein